jgi:hypothetical protein
VLQRAKLESEKKRRARWVSQAYKKGSKVNEGQIVDVRKLQKLNSSLNKINIKGYLKCSKCPFLSSTKEAFCIFLSFHLLLEIE